MAYTIEKQIRTDLPQVGSAPYRQVHAHSTGNPGSTAQNEADYMSRKDINSGFYTHVVGNGRVIQTGNTGRGAYDVGGGWNNETYAAVELIESHKSKEEFLRDYYIYCELLRNLAKEAGLPITVDSADLAGIKTHSFATHNQPYNGSDHVDPLPYLTRWGITMDQFRKDVSGATGNGGTVPQENQEKGMIDMFLIYCKDTKNYYICNGPTIAHVKTERMLGGFQGKFGGIKVPEHVMFQAEMEEQFGKVK